MEIREFSFSTLSAAKSCSDPIRLTINLPKSEKQWATILALPTLKELVLDVSAGFGDIPDGLRHARQIQKIRFEHLDKTQVMTPIPRILLELDYLQELNVVSCKNLTWEDADWSGLKSLHTFYAYNSGTHFPEGIFSLPVVETILLSSVFHWEFSAKGWSRLTHLRKLHIDHFELENTDIQDIPNLENLRVPARGAIPSFILKLPTDKLKALLLHGYFYNDGAIPIPDVIFNFSQLEELQFYSFQLKEINDKIGQLRRLRKLDLRYNHLSSLPASLAQLDQLEELMIGKNHFQRLPGVVAKLARLKKLSFDSPNTHSSEQTRFEKFLQWFETHTWTQELREVLADFWDAPQYQKPVIHYKKIERSLFIGISPINTNALAWLTQHSPQAYRPLQKGDKIGILAKLAMKRSELKEKLEGTGIGIASKLDEAGITHWLIDEKCEQTGIDWLGNLNYRLMTEAQLTAFLNEVRPDFIVEDAQNNSESDMVAQVNSLLLSGDSGNIGVGLGLLKSGGVPEACKTALFVVYKLAEDAQQRSAAGKLLQTVASENLRDAMKKRINFLSKDTPGAYQLYSYLSAYDNTEIDMGLFARIYAKPREYADIQLYLIKRNDSQHLRAYYQEQVDANGHLEISISYGKEGIDYLPVEIFDAQGVHSLHIYVYLYTTPRLELILRPELRKFKTLRSLSVYVSGANTRSINEVPPALTELKQLGNLKINATDAVKEQLIKALPGCLVT